LLLELWWHSFAAGRNRGRLDWRKTITTIVMAFHLLGGWFSWGSRIRPQPGCCMLFRV